MALNRQSTMNERIFGYCDPKVTFFCAATARQPKRSRNLLVMRRFLFRAAEYGPIYASFSHDGKCDPIKLRNAYMLHG
jgi:hypothetical protein